MTDAHPTGAGAALAGVRVLELATRDRRPVLRAGLGDLGADVVKVEPPGAGDVLRQWGWGGDAGDSLWWRVTGRNKRSVTVDLRRPEGQRLVRRLAREVDVVVENFRPGTLERWGLGYEELSAANPGLVLVRISGFGQDGRTPPGRLRGHRRGDGRPAGAHRLPRPPAGAGRGVHRRLPGRAHGGARRRGRPARPRAHRRGQVVDASIYESVLAITEALVPEWQVARRRRQRTGPTLPGVAPSNVYPPATARC